MVNKRFWDETRAYNGRLVTRVIQDLVRRANGGCRDEDV